MAHGFIDKLRRFNRKERYWLLETAVEDAFRLSEKFRCDLKQSLEFDFEIPADAYVAMDYHLNWIYAALHPKAVSGEEVHNPNGHWKLPRKAGMVETQLIEQNQEDVDLIVAFPSAEDSKRIHLIFIEAKTDSGWTEGQFRRKARRLYNIFCKCKDCERLVDQEDGVVMPNFVLMSPRSNKPKSKLLKWPGAWKTPDSDGCEASLDDIPKWFFTRDLADDEKGPEAFDKIAWVELKFGDGGPDRKLAKVTKTAQDSKFWKLQNI